MSMLCYIIIVFGFCSISIKCNKVEWLDIEEGSKCTWLKRAGTCVNLYRCMSALIDIENRKPPPTCISNGDIPVICCTDCNLVNDTRNFVYNKKIGIHQKTGEASRDYCLKILHELDYPCKRVTYTSINKYLWRERKCYVIKAVVKRAKKLSNPFSWKEELLHLALLGYGADEATVKWQCGGSLISDNFILTAAHCLQHDKFGKVTYAGLGVRKRRDSLELWQRYRITKSIPYPMYAPPSKYHDIALLKTEIPVLFNFHVVPICLPQANYVLRYDTAMSSSIGNVEKGQRAINPNYIYMKRYYKKECTRLFPPSKELSSGFNDTTQVCYGYKTKKKIHCANDIGASLHKRNAYFACGFTIVGISSFEKVCKHKGGYGLFTNVYFYKSWIEGIVWSDNIV